jgi:hypothetical protein
MKTGYTHISIVLDRSGSMETVKSDTIGGFNSFLREQRAVASEATLTLAQFDDHYDVLADFAPLNNVQPLNDRTFVPRGSTALLDAIGKTILDTGKHLAAMPDADRPSHILFVVMTDGMENASKEFTRSRIFEMISHQREKYAWEFVFIGANQDAIATGESMGIAAGNSIAFAATSAGTQDIMGKLSSNVNARRMRAAAPALAGTVAEEPFFSAEDRATRPDLPKGKA